jgi:hypothetical protein
LGEILSYTSRPLYRQIEWGVYSGSDNASVDTTPSDVGPTNSTLPTFTGTILFAYLDMIIGGVKNTSGGVNAIGPNTQYIQIKETTAGSYTNAHKMWAGMFTLTDGSIWPVGRIYGDINIASVLIAAGSGGSITWKWTNACSLADDLDFHGTFRPVLRVIFR